jgi:hypothetical protein
MNSLIFGGQMTVETVPASLLKLEIEQDKRNFLSKIWGK